MSNDPPRDACLPPGYDEGEAYADEDLASVPDWWQDNVTTFRRHDMRPYRPSRFADDAVVQKVVQHLEADLDVTVTLRAVDPETQGDWTVTVDGEAVATLERERTAEAFTRYEVTAAAFEDLVREAVQG